MSDDPKPTNDGPEITKTTRLKGVVPRCQAITRILSNGNNGPQCLNAAQHKSKYCGTHARLDISEK